MVTISIVGGGFAGVWAAMSAAGERTRLGLSADDINIHLISNQPDLVIRPRLYEGAKSEMQVPLRPLLDTIEVQLDIAQVVNIRPSDKQIILAGAPADRHHTYDRLVLASGSRMRALPIPGADTYGYSVDTFTETERFDRHLAALAEKSAVVHVVVVGAGFTGIELVTELRKRLGRDAKLTLIDNAPDIGRNLGENLAPLLLSALETCEIDVRLNASIATVDEHALTLASGEALKAQAVVFATGQQASPLTDAFAAPKDASGRLIVDAHLSLHNVTAVFVAGDIARAMADDHHPTFMSCQHAIELGRHAGYNAVRSLAGQELRAYRQEDYATCLDLGPAGAVLTSGWEREVQKTGAEGKAIKKQISEEWIYPPNPDSGAASIFDFIAFDQHSEAA